MRDSNSANAPHQCTYTPYVEEQTRGGKKEEISLINIMQLTSPPSRLRKHRYALGGFVISD